MDIETEDYQNDAVRHEDACHFPAHNELELGEGRICNDLRLGNNPRRQVALARAAKAERGSGAHLREASLASAKTVIQPLQPSPMFRCMDCNYVHRMVARPFALTSEAPLPRTL